MQIEVYEIVSDDKEIHLATIESTNPLVDLQKLLEKDPDFISSQWSTVLTRDHAEYMIKFTTVYNKPYTIYYGRFSKYILQELRKRKYPTE